MTLRREAIEFDLPPELVARYPKEARDASRLLSRAADGSWVDGEFHRIRELLRPGDLLVLNDTRVMPARLHGARSTGGRVEVLIERCPDECTALAHIKAGRAPVAGVRLLLGAQKAEAQVQGRAGDFFLLRFERPVRQLLQEEGEVPLPPYLGRRAEAIDRERYQTVYARREGAVAAPTAGLHFTRELLDSLAGDGIPNVSITLHVGAGTFQPIREDDLTKHRMHPEWAEISAAACRRINACRAAGGRVIAVGSTSLRALETAAQATPAELAPWSGDTGLYILPGYRFRLVDALITNFHLPGSSLLLLVAALVGLPVVMDGYRHAIARRYRFFSYGDAMFLERRAQSDGAA